MAPAKSSALPLVNPTNGSHFEYSHGLSAQEIRLLEISHGREEEPIHFTLHTFPLGDVPDYVALSYTWGDPTDTVPVLCDGKVMNVTRSLGEALRQLRNNWKITLRQAFPGKSLARRLYFWIDAVCINQSDSEEKSCQVGRMADIYRQAYDVIVWLGQADDSSDSVMDYLDKFGAKAEACGLDSGVEPYRQLWQDMISTPQMMQILSLSDQGVALMKLFNSISGWHDQSNLFPAAGMNDLFTRPWWGRIWVLQEVALPRNAKFLCGTKWTTRSRLSAAINAYYALWLILMSRSMDCIHFTKYQFQVVRSTFIHRPTIMLSSWRIHRFDRFPLSALLRLTCVGSTNLRRHGPHHLESTDPRDKIFALLGLAKDREEIKALGVFPDYKKSKKEVYAMTMAALLQQGYTSLLSFCRIPRSSADLPSWVPDWSQSMTHGLQDVKDDHVTIYPSFNASGVQSQHSHVVIHRKDGAISSISMMCHVYDDIYEVGSFPTRHSSDEVPLSETCSWPSDWLIEILRLTYNNRRAYVDLSHRLSEAARTSIGGVGFSADKRLMRVGESRFLDAVFLLQERSSYIKQDYIRCQVRRFLDSKVIKHMVKHRPAMNKIMLSRLGPEIIGKSLGRLPFLSGKGHLVLSSEHVKRGDSVVLIKGAQVPFILRHESGTRFRIVSEAYVEGIMDGEAMQRSRCEMIELI